MRLTLILLICALGGVGSAQQEQWTTAHVAPAGRLDVQMCWNAADGRVVAVSPRHGFVNFETWEWDGTTWHQRHPAASPPIRQAYGLAYDAARRVVVLFGGLDTFTGELSDTWEWDSVTWTRRSPASLPPPRHSMAMTYDSRRQRVVVYGGSNGSTTLADLWEWNGTTWAQQVLGKTNPGPRAGSVMTYDSRRGVAVMFGGIDLGLSYLDDVWEYDGAQWTHSVPTVRPPGLRGASLTFDTVAGRTILCGGDVGGKPNTDLWEWDGKQWQKFTTTVNPGAQLGAGLAFDTRRNRTVLHGTAYELATWTWDRAKKTWTRQYDAPKPIRSSLAANNGLGRTLFVAGFETFEWDHAASMWLRRPSVSHPSPFLLGALAFDFARRQGVLFGAMAQGSAETWIWDEQTRAWQKRTPTKSPPPTQFGALAFDRTRSRTVLFGGILNGTTPTFSAQTWEWDGATWVQKNPKTSPPARIQAAMHYDLLTKRVVLFGGTGSAGTFGDVWEWDGVDWKQRVMQNAGPAPRRAMGIGGRTDGLLIVGGSDAFGTPNNELWALRKNLWVRLPSGGLPALTPAQAAVDTLSGELTVFGGDAPDRGLLLFTNGIWNYGIPRAAEAPIGGGCTGSNGLPELVGSGLPKLGNTTYGLEARNFVAQQPAGFMFSPAASLSVLSNRCRLFVSTPFALLTTVVAASGKATVALPVPQTPSLAGVMVYAQAAALDPSGPAITVTQAIRLRLGR